MQNCFLWKGKLKNKTNKKTAYAKNEKQLQSQTSEQVLKAIA